MHIGQTFPVDITQSSRYHLGTHSEVFHVGDYTRFLGQTFRLFVYKFVRLALLSAGPQQYAANTCYYVGRTCYLLFLFQACVRGPNSTPPPLPSQ